MKPLILGLHRQNLLSKIFSSLFETQYSQVGVYLVQHIKHLRVFNSKLHETNMQNTFSTLVTTDDIFLRRTVGLIFKSFNNEPQD